MTASSAPDNSRPAASEPLPDAAAIRRLERRAAGGLWLLALFLGLSLAAWSGFALFPPLPERLRTLLGPAPPTGLISIALVVYSFSAIILLLARLGSEPSRRGGLAHLGYLAGFYLFYHFGAQLADNFLAVFAAGLTILGLYSYQAWSFYSGLAREARDRLERLQRTRPFAADRDAD